MLFLSELEQLGFCQMPADIGEQGGVSLTPGLWFVLTWNDHGPVVRPI
jgi:hypothetical protein